ncbi:putative lipid II flippase FtsW [Arthrobacter parietis]|uniref:Probable peptidoglycan glycosyltransferase FtsW n=2 Tax=Arthrobacter TaxID=1663 RepID=A0ABT6CT67_9MICC|nr:putative lipid II flippase FtsW [Arthrobacter vasquezii]MDF9277252.1 putative lipid II flippase FtsW [Arthrobacter vasquezii]
MVSTPTRHPRRRPAARQHSGSRGSSRVNASGNPAADAIAARPERKGVLGAFGRMWRFLEGSDRQTSGSSYYMILGATLALTAIGLMMVLSASSVESIANAASTVEPTDEGAIVFDFFFKQSMYAVLGVVLMLVLSRLGPRVFKFLAWPGLGVAIVLLVLVLLIGENINGNQNWIRIGNQSLQPSEPAKLALALWCATVLERKRGLIRDWKHALIPVAPLGGVILLLVMLGGDLGTAIILGMIMAAALFFAGAPMKLFTLVGLLGIAGAFGAILLNSTRSTRIQAWLRLNCESATDPCFQTNQGLFALASGGWWGVGIGQSRQKWNWIPEAHNDFIFAIIGEEFGLIGTLVVIALFGILAVATLRVARRYTDPFVRILMGSILVWLIGQAFVNIGMVTGVLPVIGVPLPFISYGGSALTFTLAAVGVLLAFARRMPPAVPGTAGPAVSSNQTSASDK